MSNDKDTAAPYYYEPSVIVHDMYQVRDAQGHPVANLCTEEEAKGRVRVLNAAFQAGQKSVIPSDPRGLSDEEIERYASQYTTPTKYEVLRALRYARDKGFLSPSKPAEQAVMSDEEVFELACDIEVQAQKTWRGNGPLMPYLVECGLRHAWKMGPVSSKDREIIKRLVEVLECLKKIITDLDDQGIHIESEFVDTAIAAARDHLLTH